MCIHTLPKVPAVTCCNIIETAYSLNTHNSILKLIKMQRFYVSVIKLQKSVHNHILMTEIMQEYIL